MKRLLPFLPLLLILSISILLIVHGPIPQLAHYHEFADQAVAFGIPHAADVISNIGFFIVGLWGLLRLWPMQNHPALKAGWPGYALFLIALLFTAVGSSYYHLAPDNARLIWDRLPIALACAGLLAAVRAEMLPNTSVKMNAALFSIFAIVSVAWWYATEQNGAGDLRLYLLLQGASLVLIPLWQAIYRAPMADRLAFGLALLLYIVAKAAEVSDHQLFNALGFISGHTLKHIVATTATWVLVFRLIQRVRS